MYGYLFIFLIVSYIGLVLYVVIKKLSHWQLPLSKWIKVALLAGPVVLYFVLVPALTEITEHEKKVYSEWTKKCGHGPIVGKTDQFNYSYAQIGIKAEGATFAEEYFCSFTEAYAAGFEPNGNSVDKEDFIYAGYTPTKEDLDLVNKYRVLNHQEKITY